MKIVYSQESGEFHLYNEQVSYILKILPNGEIGNLYYGKKVRHKSDFSYLLEGKLRSLAVYTKENDYFFSPQYSRMEYPGAGTGDFREPAYIVKQKNGSRITGFKYCFHKIYDGKKPLQGLPAVYVESDREAMSLEITLQDELLHLSCILKYSIFSDAAVITRSCEFVNEDKEDVTLESVMSASVDFPDSEFEMLQLSGAWSRERKTIRRKLQPGVQSIGSVRGISSAEQNPFVAVMRPGTDENNGEVYGFNLVYSGNHRELIEVDTFNMTRVQIGIHPQEFEWKLRGGEHFQSPEAVLVYSSKGLNGMSQTYHKLYRTRLVRGKWRDQERPILLNNWEATGAEFNEESLLKLASTGKKLGIELFVLDDGWFGNRENDMTGLGDWYVKNTQKLPNGVTGLSEQIEKMGMKFGLWFEPEMVSKDSDLFRKHPDWILCAPGRKPSPSRNQYVLDFSREEVRDYIYHLMESVLSSAKISYVKWDMNRYITECYSLGKKTDEQGKVMHLYILGVYQLYEKLLQRFPDILFESCSSGGARFDPGMLYYAPQTWTSDDTDAMERLKIQYGTSMAYPLSTMGAHVSEVPNQQVGRVTPLETRGNVAQFGLLGYELDLNKLDDMDMIEKQVQFAKKHRSLIMKGTFYRLLNPMENNDGAWMVVSEDKTQALVGFYRMNGIPNGSWNRLYLQGLDSERDYMIQNGDGRIYGGDELISIGMVITEEELCNRGGDFSSRIYELKAV